MALLHGAVRRVAGIVGRADCLEPREGAGVRDRAAAARIALAAGYELPATRACRRWPPPRRRAELRAQFEGLVNPLLFNIGLPTAHHEHPRAHWSELTRLHREHYRHHVNPALNEAGLTPYMFRVFVLGAVVPRFRSRSCMAP